MKVIRRFGLFLGTLTAVAVTAAPAFAVTVTATVSPAEVSRGTERYVPIQPAGSNATAKFTITLSEAADIQVRAKNRDTDTNSDANIKSYGKLLVFAGQSATDATFTNQTSVNLSITKASQGLSDEKNQIVIYGRATGTSAAITATTLKSFNVFIDGVAPSAPASLSADGADGLIFVRWDAPTVTGAINDVTAYYVTYSDTDFSAATTADAIKLKYEKVNKTEGTISGLTNGTTYFVSVRSVDWATNASDFPRDAQGKIIVARALPTKTLTLAEIAGEKGGGCFIATAAFGSYQAPHVRVLREFRDRVLLTNAPGTNFVRWYYRTSPAYAAWIARHDTVRAVVRVLLWPVIAGAFLFLHPLWALLAGVLLLGLAFARIARHEAHA